MTCTQQATVQATVVNGTEGTIKSVVSVALAAFIQLAFAQASNGSDLRYHFGPTEPRLLPGIAGIMASDDDIKSFFKTTKLRDAGAPDAQGRQLNLRIYSQNSGQIDTSNRTAYNAVQSLEIHEVEFTSYHFLDNLPSLQDALIVSSAPGQINQSLLNALSTCRSLNRLTLYGSGSPLNFAVLRRLPQLHRLILSRCDMTQTTIDQISQIGSLQSLEVENPNINEVGTIDLAKLKSLRELRLSGTALGAAKISSVARLSNLNWLELRGINSENYIKVVSSLANLRRLSLVGNIVPTYV
jgi:hypothetical protein